MGRDPLGERWPLVYRQSPEVFDRFSRAEDRSNLVAPALVEAAGLEGARVLEVGCGTGRWTRQLAPLARTYSALEPQAGMLEIARLAGACGASLMVGQAQSLPFADGSLDRLLGAWVFANLRPKTRADAVSEALRVTGERGEIWLLENHWDDDFQGLRKDAGLPVEVEIAPLIDEHGFEIVETLETEMCFASESDAQDILGQILGPRVAKELGMHPRRELLHRVCLLHRP
jgi:ubiquinone/menaquinone biosynthesis C-methylase UbiE